MDLNRCLREAGLDEETLDFLPMIALKQYESFFGCSSASAVGFELSSQIVEIDALRIYALDNSGSLTPFSGFEAHLDKLLLHTDGSADTKILRKTTSGTNFRHNSVQLLLYSNQDIVFDSI
jgi:hypothetical protein